MIDVTWHHHAPPTVGFTASLVAIFGGFYAAATAPDQITTWAAFTASLAGLATAVGAIVVSLARLRAEQRAADRKAEVDLARIQAEQATAARTSAEERHALADQLQVTKFQVTELQVADRLKDEQIALLKDSLRDTKQALGINRAWITAFAARRDGEPIPAAPEHPQ